MGNTSGKSSQGDDVVTSFQHLSNHDGKLTEREAASAWYRYGVSVTDVYDIVEFLGHGHMGETFTVRRKTTGHHTAHTREQSKGSESDLLKLAKEREEKEAKKAHKKSMSDASGPKKLKSPKKLVIKAKGVRKVSGGSSKGGKETDEDDNHDLSHFIKTDEDIAAEVIHEPPKHSTQPVKSIMKDTYERKFSSASELTSSTHHTREDSTASSLDTFGRLESSESTDSPSGGGSSKSKKGVHFQRSFAVKTILTSRVNTGQLQELVNEIMIMRKLDHPYIVKLYEVYHVKRKLWLVTELLTGGDLSTRKLNEHQTKNVIEQVLRALVYLHRMGIVHRDIKLENILYENHSKNATVRLIDFGLSRTFDRRSTAADYARNPYTISPETAKVLLSSKDARASDEIMTDKKDVWAVGVVTFLLLSGEFPFIKSNSDLKDPEKMNKLKRADFQFGITWKGRGITPKAKEFIKGCLQADPDKRWTAKQALENLHNEWAPEVDKIWNEWQAEAKKFKNPEFVKDISVEEEDEDEEDNVDGVDGADQSAAASTSNNGDEDDDAEVPAYKPNGDLRANKIKKHVQKIVRSKRSEAPEQEDAEKDFVDMDEIERYTKFGFMKKTILLTMANTMDRSELVRLREIFLKADTNDTGTITLQELLAAFRKVSPDVDVARVENLFIGMDRDKSGHIHYAEFLAALAESHGLVTLDRLTEAFDRLDTDGKGYIDRDDLKKVLGKEYDEVTVDKMIEEGDFKKNNKIDYEELLQLMFSDPVKGDKIAGA